VAELIFMITQIITLLIFARVIMSWMISFGRMNPYSPLAKTIYDLTEPMLAPVRNLLPPASGFDFSPIIVLIGVQVIGQLLIGLVG
jgi:YggT family protein